MTQQLDSSLFLYTIPKNDTEEFQLAVRPYEGKLYMDLRLWFRDENDTLIPTRKGIFLSLEQARDLQAGLDQLLCKAAIIVQQAAEPPRRNRNSIGDKALQDRTQRIK